MPPDFASHHAATRLQQRAISADGIDFLLAYGKVARSKGADSYFFDNAARERVKQSLDRDTLRRLDKYLDAYAIVDDDGSLVTAAWRTRRLRHH